MKKLKVLIVFAHPDPKSLCSALKTTCAETLRADGHDVKISDLYASKLILPLGKEDFTSLANPAYFKPQSEQQHANGLPDFGTFIPELKEEHEKLKWCDMLLMVFPIHFSFFPGIMKNWIDRVFSSGFAYGFWHNLKGKKAMVIFTTPENRVKFNETEQYIFHLINATIFDFCKMSPLIPYVAYSSDSAEQAEKDKCLTEVTEVMHNIDGRHCYSSPFSSSCCTIF